MNQCVKSAAALVCLQLVPKSSNILSNFVLFPPKSSTSAISAQAYPSAKASLARAIMDTNDVSDIHQHIQCLNAQKKILEAAAARTGEIPTDRKTQGELITKHQLMDMQSLMRQFGGNKNQVRSSFVPPPYPASIASLEQLTPIFIKDLKLGVHHRGNYLLVKSVTTPNRINAIMFVVLDEKENAVEMQLYQQPDENVRPASTLVTKGSIFLIKEPFFKVMGDGGYGLRIDHISDVLHIDTRHELCPTQWCPRLYDLNKPANDWKQEGNVAMGRKNYWQAIKLCE